MAEYTYSNIIIDPTKEGIENLIGKEVYISDVPKYCLCHANKNDSEYLAVLKAIRKDHVCPFLVKRQNINYEEAHSCIIVKKEEPYSKRAKKWIEQNDLKEGDYVKVTRKVNDHEDEWQGLWLDHMDESVGKTLKVKDIDTYVYTISLENGFYYPYFVLEKTEPLKPEYVPFESKEEFIEAFHYHDNDKYSETDDILLNYGIWLKDKNSHEIFLVTGVFNQSIHICDFDSDESWGELLNEFTFLDGSPCGKEYKDV